LGAAAAAADDDDDDDDDNVDRLQRTPSLAGQAVTQD